MTDREYTDGYLPDRPELIPESQEQANSWVETAINTGISTCDTQTFLRAWWAFAWLNPGFHPDDFEEWSEQPHAKELTEEAIRRVEANEIDRDSEFYAADATHNAMWLVRTCSPNAPRAQPHPNSLHIKRPSKSPMTNYQQIIKTILDKIGSDADPRHIEGFMRLEYSSLSHLPKSKFVAETKAFLTIPKEDWPMWEENAVSFGL